MRLRSVLRSGPCFDSSTTLGNTRLGRALTKQHGVADAKAYIQVYGQSMMPMSIQFGAIYLNNFTRRIGSRYDPRPQAAKPSGAQRKTSRVINLQSGPHKTNLTWLPCFRDSSHLMPISCLSAQSGWALCMLHFHRTSSPGPTSEGGFETAETLVALAQTSPMAAKPRMLACQDAPTKSLHKACA
jgi:hypothetical protein